MRPVYKQFACSVHRNEARAHLCPACAIAVQAYRQAMQDWRKSEAAEMRERLSRKANSRPVTEQELRMDETTWSEWFRGKWEYQKHWRFRSQNLDREIRAVYWSEVRPKHFRNAFEADPRILNVAESMLRKETAKRDFYPIAKLLRASDTSNP